MQKINWTMFFSYLGLQILLYGLLLYLAGIFNQEIYYIIGLCIGMMIQRAADIATGKLKIEGTKN